MHRSILVVTRFANCATPDPTLFQIISLALLLLSTMTCASSHSPSSGTDGPSVAGVQAFLGTWVRADTTVTTCSSDNSVTTTFGGNVVIAPGSTSGTLAALSPVGCVTSYSVDGNVATAPSGQTCNEAADGGVQTETLETHTLILSTDGQTIGSASSSSISDPASRTTCTTTSSGTWTKSSGEIGDAAPLPNVCTVPTSCISRFTIPGSAYQLPYYSTFPIGSANRQITEAVVFVEGEDHNAANYFSVLVTAAAMANRLADTLILAPHFEVVDSDSTSMGTSATSDASASESCGGNDQPEPGDLVWTCDAWLGDVAATDASGITSFESLDALVTAMEQTFPQLQRVVISGFSAGGQFTDRYAAVNGIDHGNHGVPVRYVIGDPSSYLYFDERRPVDPANCTTLGCPESFAPYDSALCPGYNEWKYGTDDLAGGAASLTPVQLKQAFVARTIHYVLGTLDDGPTTVADYAQLDTSCPAEAQGPFRLQRGLAFYSYVTTLLDAGQQQAQLAPGCGHSPSCVFQSDAGISAVFGE
jgi:hypothetical protein